VTLCDTITAVTLCDTITAVTLCDTITAVTLCDTITVVTLCEYSLDTLISIPCSCVQVTLCEYSLDTLGAPFDAGRFVIAVAIELDVMVDEIHLVSYKESLVSRNQVFAVAEVVLF